MGRPQQSRLPDGAAAGHRRAARPDRSGAENERLHRFLRRTDGRAGIAGCAGCACAGAGKKSRQRCSGGAVCAHPAASAAEFPRSVPAVLAGVRVRRNRLPRPVRLFYGRFLQNCGAAGAQSLPAGAVDPVSRHAVVEPVHRRQRRKRELFFQRADQRDPGNRARIPVQHAEPDDARQPVDAGGTVAKRRADHCNRHRNAGAVQRCVRLPGAGRPGDSAGRCTQLLHERMQPDRYFRQVAHGAGGRRSVPRKMFGAGAAQRPLHAYRRPAGAGDRRPRNVRYIRKAVGRLLHPGKICNRLRH